MFICFFKSNFDKVFAELAPASLNSPDCAEYLTVSMFRRNLIISDLSWCQETHKRLYYVTNKHASDVEENQYLSISIILMRTNTKILDMQSTF